MTATRRNWTLGVVSVAFPAERRGLELEAADVALAATEQELSLVERESSMAQASLAIFAGEWA